MEEQHKSQHKFENLSPSYLPFRTGGSTVKHWESKSCLSLRGGNKGSNCVVHKNSFYVHEFEKHVFL